MGLVENVHPFVLFTILTCSRCFIQYEMTFTKQLSRSMVGAHGWMEKYTKLCQECAISERNIILCVASFYIASFVLLGGSLTVNSTSEQKKMLFLFLFGRELDRTENGEKYINFMNE